MHSCRPQGATLRKVRSLIFRQYRFHRYFLHNKKPWTSFLRPRFFYTLNKLHAFYEIHSDQTFLSLFD